MMLPPLSLLSLMVMACGDKEAGGDSGADSSPPSTADVDGDGVESPEDCDDLNADINPNVIETCDGTDNNCSGDETDAIDALTWFADADGDTYGSPASTTASCSPPSGYVDNADDCDDTNAAIQPGVLDWIDGADNNCDGTADEIILSSALDSLDASGSITIADDVDGDKQADLILGDSRYIGSLTNCAAPGTTYVMSGPLSGTTSISTATASIVGDTISGDCFGYSVAAGDINHDGYSDLVVGSHADDGGGSVHGFLGYSGFSGLKTLSATDFSLPAANSGDMRGYAVLLADFTGDGYDDVIMGSPQEQRGSPLSSFGAIRVYAGGPTGVNTTDFYCAYSPAKGAYTGFSIAAGNIDGTGGASLIVGSPYRAGAGMVHIIDGIDATSFTCDSIDLLAKQSFTGLNDGDTLGYKVAVVGDIDDDGYNELALAAIGDDANGASSGAVYLFYSGSLTTTSTLADADITFEGDGAGFDAGRAITAIPDLDGEPGLAISATGYTTGSLSEQGAVYIFRSSSLPSTATVTLSTADLIIVGTATNQRLGASLAAGPIGTDGEAMLIMGSSSGQAFLLPLD